MLLNATVGSCVVAFGDSTTAPRENLVTYADLLRAELPGFGVNVDVINAGVRGNTSADGRQRFAADVLAHDPGLVIIQFGINDAAVDVWKDPPATSSRVAMVQFIDNLTLFIEQLRRRSAAPLLMTPNPLHWTPELLALYGKPPYRPDDADGFNLILRDYAEAVRVLATRTTTPLIDIFALFDSLPLPELLLDGIHPNARGHRLVADQLLAVLV
ncbi:MAG: GDSL-type esterase/lipase family protein [Caldilineaceae bacterium]|nr:hypothetical protein [Caldilineaceae bacterium]